MSGHVPLGRRIAQIDPLHAVLPGEPIIDIVTAKQTVCDQDIAKRGFDAALHMQRMTQIVGGDLARFDQVFTEGPVRTGRRGGTRPCQPERKIAHTALPIVKTRAERGETELIAG